MSTFELRDLSGMDEFLAAEDLQRLVWGAGDVPDPADLLMVIQHEGGLVGGAFLHAQLVGYVFGFPTREPDVQHSHRLAVHPSYRGRGLAVQLKQYQRSWCLERGIQLVRWTYDPQRHTNAHLNIGRLGAVVRKYFPDYYGEMKGINAGVPSDRLLAEWHLGDGLERGDVVQRVYIGRDFEALMAQDVKAATQSRLVLRAELQAALADGLAITGYDSVDASYLLSRTKISSH
jgi:predicted GNAT superfamily acetyltransferase